MVFVNELDQIQLARRELTEWASASAISHFAPQPAGNAAAVFLVGGAAFLAKVWLFEKNNDEMEYKPYDSSI